MGLVLVVLEAAPATAMVAGLFKKYGVEGETVGAALIPAWIAGAASFALAPVVGVAFTAVVLGVSVFHMKRLRRGE